MFNVKKYKLAHSLLILIILFFSSCRKNQINLNNVVQTNLKLKNLDFKLIVDGVECKVCAKKVVNLLESIGNVSKAEFLCPGGNFDNCYANVYLNNNLQNIDLDDIEQKLKKEGFSLKSIKGEFLAQITKNETEYFVSLLNSKKFIKLHSLKNGKIKFDKFYNLTGRVENQGDFAYFVIDRT